MRTDFDYVHGFQSAIMGLLYSHNLFIYGLLIDVHKKFSYSQFQSVPDVLN